MNGTKIAAIWCRVSTHDQRELSLDSQEDAVRRVLKEQGYEVRPQYVLRVDWSSMDLMACPEFQQLRRWIAEGTVQAIGALDRDRLQAQGLQRLVFLSECRDNGVPVITVQGIAMLEGGEGQLVELALALGKERSVLRAQQGARDGLRDRAKLKGLPAVPKNPYGYTWDDTKTRLIPTSDWPNAEFICRSALGGMPIRTIVKELHHRSIPTATGKERWAPRTIHWILTSPIYGGRYYALRQSAVEPKKRLAQTYGKSSYRLKSLAESIKLDNIVIERAPLTWEEWLALQEQMKTNQRQAQRNAKRDYLLRSLVFCDAHHRRYHGREKGNRWIYACSTRSEPGHSPCPRPNLPGQALEEQVKSLCRVVLESPEIIEQEIKSRTGTVQSTGDAIRKSLAALDRKGTGNLDTETNLALEKARGNVSQEAYDRALARVRAERTWIIEERERLQSQLQTLEQGQAALLGLAQARERLAGKLDGANVEEWRMIFNALGAEVHVTDEGTLDVDLAIPLGVTSIVAHTPGGHPQPPGREPTVPCTLLWPQPERLRSITIVSWAHVEDTRLVGGTPCLGPELGQLARLGQGQKHDVGGWNTPQGARSAGPLGEPGNAFTSGPLRVDEQGHWVPAMARHHRRGGVVPCHHQHVGRQLL